MKIFITGGAGYIGTSLIPLLCQLSPHQWVYTAVFNVNIGKYSFTVSNKF